ncbi:hypothetical protein EDC04DRAFT_2599761 [Pisolithus marmoratus]|nr:hypothetical protein EDC04DRAFT_2599761 [Pisolithus marmoratus]
MSTVRGMLSSLEIRASGCSLVGHGIPCTGSHTVPGLAQLPSYRKHSASQSYSGQIHWASLEGSFTAQLRGGQTLLRKILKLNVDVLRHLAILAKNIRFNLVYISTGQFTPYHPWSEPNPLHVYGKSKRDGELAVLSVASATVIVPQVPVLQVWLQPQGNLNPTCPTVNTLLEVVEDQSGKSTRWTTTLLDTLQMSGTLLLFLVHLSGRSIALDKPPMTPEYFTQTWWTSHFFVLFTIPHQKR